MERVILNQPSQPRSRAFQAPRWAGVGYPLRDDGIVSLVVDEHAINSGLYILFMTEPGERYMEPDFGVALRPIIFEQGSPGLEDEVRRRIAKGIDRFEPRIVVAAPGIDIETSEESDSAPTGAVFLGVSFRWAFKSDLSTKFDFIARLFRNDSSFVV